MSNEFKSPIQSLMNKSGEGNLSSKRLKCSIFEVFQIRNYAKCESLHVFKEVPYYMRTPSLEQAIDAEDYKLWLAYILQSRR